MYYFSPNVTHKKHNLYIHTESTAKFGNKSLTAVGTHIWNKPPEFLLHRKNSKSSLKHRQDQYAKYCSGLFYK